MARERSIDEVLGLEGPVEPPAIFNSGVTKPLRWSEPGYQYGLLAELPRWEGNIMRLLAACRGIAAGLVRDREGSGSGATSLSLGGTPTVVPRSVRGSTDVRELSQRLIHAIHLLRTAGVSNAKTTYRRG